jgi:hypothetical protein
MMSVPSRRPARRNGADKLEKKLIASRPGAGYGWLSAPQSAHGKHSHSSSEVAPPRPHLVISYATNSKILKGSASPPHRRNQPTVPSDDTRRPGGFHPFTSGSRPQRRAAIAQMRCRVHERHRRPRHESIDGPIEGAESRAARRDKEFRLRRQLGQALLVMRQRPLQPWLCRAQALRLPMQKLHVRVPRTPCWKGSRAACTEGMTYGPPRKPGTSCPCPVVPRRCWRGRSTARPSCAADRDSGSSSASWASPEDLRSCGRA